MIYAGKGVKGGELYWDSISPFSGEYYWGDGIIMGGKGRSAKKKEKESSLMNVTDRKIVGLFLSLALKVMINDSTRKR